jgi:hypothetical protein
VFWVNQIVGHHDEDAVLLHIGNLVETRGHAVVVAITLRANEQQECIMMAAEDDAE